MTIYVPWGLIAIFIAFYTFYHHNRRARLRREERKENLDNRRQELLDYLHKTKQKNISKEQPVKTQKDTEADSANEPSQ